MAGLTESVVEDAALACLESLGYAIKHGPDISPAGDTLILALSQERGILAAGGSCCKKRNSSNRCNMQKIHIALKRQD